ncbi:MAG: SRPBCC family protein [Myxococcota bacterium]
MTRALRVLALALSPAFAGGSASAEVTGDEARELLRAGCSVRTLEIDARGVATVAAECAWPLAPERVLATLRDPQKLGDSLTSLGEFRRLSDGRVLQVHTIGWPLDDRQVTLDWRESALPEGGMRFDYRRAARQEPLADGRVGIIEDEGRWLIRPDGAGGTRLSYRSRYDAGGSLKPWLVRRFQRGGIAASLAELRAAVAAR